MLLNTAEADWLYLLFNQPFDERLLEVWPAILLIYVHIRPPKLAPVSHFNTFQYISITRFESYFVYNYFTRAPTVLLFCCFYVLV